MTLTKRINLSKSNTFAELKGYYSQDMWDLYEHHKFLSLSVEEQERFKRKEIRHYVHFENCNSLQLREELKYWMYHLIEVVDKKLSSLSANISNLQNFIVFANTWMPSVNSLLDVPLDDFLERFNNYLQFNGYKREYNSASIITKDMKKKRYTYENGALTGLRRMYPVIESYLNSDIKSLETEYEKDKWDVRNLPFKVGLPPSRPRYTISFLKIHQVEIKKYAKKYAYMRLKVKSYNTCVDDLKGINEFSDFLSERHPNIQDLSGLDRSIILDYISFIRTFPKLGITSKRSRLGTLRTFLETCRFNEWGDINSEVLMYDDDMRFKVKTLPNYYTDSEIRTINEHITELPTQITWMLFVIQSVGMRVSELCSLKKENLIHNPNGSFTLNYRQHKSNNMNTVPITKEVAEVLKTAIEYAEITFGENVKHIFARSEKKFITSDSFSEYINKMSYRNNLVGDNGKPLRLRSHSFRGTVATKYANLGLSQEVIRMMLGQKSIGSLKHYVEVHNGTVLDAMKGIIDVQNSLIKNIGSNGKKTQHIERSVCGTPLPNGTCNKPLKSEPCDHANACYTCRMFVANIDYLPIYKHQLLEAENNIKIAQINDWERIEQINTDLSASLRRTIESLEGANLIEQ